MELNSADTGAMDLINKYSELNDELKYLNAFYPTKYQLGLPKLKRRNAVCNMLMFYKKNNENLEKQLSKKKKEIKIAINKQEMLEMTYLPVDIIQIIMGYANPDLLKFYNRIRKQHNIPENAINIIFLQMCVDIDM